jgi:hypothetical protein
MRVPARVIANPVAIVSLAFLFSGTFPKANIPKQIREIATKIKKAIFHLLFLSL